MSDRQGADARRDATSGHFVCLCCPGAGALDPVIQVRILEGQVELSLGSAVGMGRMSGNRGLRVPPGGPGLEGNRQRRGPPLIPKVLLKFFRGTWEGNP